MENSFFIADLKLLLLCNGKNLREDIWMAACLEVILHAFWFVRFLFMFRVYHPVPHGVGVGSPTGI